MDWIEHLIIMIVLIAAAVAIVQVFLPMLPLGIPAPVMQLFRILLWAAVVIVGIIICFDLFRCLIGSVHM